MARNRRYYSLRHVIGAFGHLEEGCGHRKHILDCGFCLERIIRYAAHRDLGWEKLKQSWAFYRRELRCVSKKRPKKHWSLADTDIYASQPPGNPEEGHAYAICPRGPDGEQYGWLDGWPY